MLTEVYYPFQTKTAARKALTAVRKRYRVALRGSVAIDTHSREGNPEVRLFVCFSGSGLNAPELASILRCMSTEGGK